MWPLFLMSLTPRPGSGSAGSRRDEGLRENRAAAPGPGSGSSPRPAASVALTGEAPARPGRAHGSSLVSSFKMLSALGFSATRGRSGPAPESYAVAMETAAQGEVGVEAGEAGARR